MDMPEDDGKPWPEADGQPHQQKGEGRGRGKGVKNKIPVYKRRVETARARAITDHVMQYMRRQFLYTGLPLYCRHITPLSCQRSNTETDSA